MISCAKVEDRGHEKDFMSDHPFYSVLSPQNLVH